MLTERGLAFEKEYVESIEDEGDKDDIDLNGLPAPTLQGGTS